MKKILFVISLMSVIGCEIDDTPKCEDEIVKNLVYDIYRDESYRGATYENKSISNIRTMYSDKVSKSCECEATIYYDRYFKRIPDRVDSMENNIYYTAQRNSEGEIYVELMIEQPKWRKLKK